MKKPPVLLCLFLAFFSSANSQVQLILSPQSPARFSSSDVWKMNVNLMQEGPFKVFFEAKIQSAGGGTVAILQSQPVTIRNGTNQFSPLNLETRSIRYGSQIVGDYEQKSGYLPPANYTYCIRVHCADQACLNKLKIEETFKVCQQVQVVPATPLLLSIPEDEAKLKNKRPNFTWIAPMPIGAEPELTYQLTLVQLRKNQTAQSGIRRNRALYDQKGIHGTQLAFPAELDDLEEGISYAWKVDAFLGDQYITSSQVWEFEIMKEKEEIIPMPFVKLKKTDEAIYNAVNELKFIYDERRFKNQIDFRIINSRGENMNRSNKQLQTRLGENKFALALEEFELEEKEVYQLIIRRTNGESFDLKFMYHKQ